MWKQPSEKQKLIPKGSGPDQNQKLALHETVHCWYCRQILRLTKPKHIKLALAKAYLLTRKRTKQ